MQAVRAGQSLNVALANCPAAARPGTQALSFHALRWLGAAQALRTQLAPKAPPPKVDALMLTALALLWPQAQAPYAEHHPRRPGSRRRAPAHEAECRIRQRGAASLSARARCAGGGGAARPAGALQSPGVVGRALEGGLAGSLATDPRRRQPAPADDLARERASRRRGGLRRAARRSRHRGRGDRRAGGQACPTLPGDAAARLRRRRRLGAGRCRAVGRAAADRPRPEARRARARRLRRPPAARPHTWPRTR